MNTYELIVTVYCFVSLPAIFSIITILAIQRPSEEKGQIPIGKRFFSNPVGVIILPIGVILLLTFSLTNYSLSEFTKAYISGNVLLAAFITGTFAISNYLFEKQQKETKVSIIDEITTNITKNTQEIVDKAIAEQKRLREEDQQRHQEEMKRLENIIATWSNETKELLKQEYKRQGREEAQANRQ